MHPTPHRSTAALVVAIPVLATALVATAAGATASRYRIVFERLAGGRSYALQIDATAIHAQRPMLILLPGLGETAARLEQDAAGYRFGRAHGITIAYGHQLRDPSGKLSWNAGGCCARAAADDVGYLRQLATHAQRHTGIDHRRVYVVGMSNGGMMALRAICEAPTVFAAAGSVAGPRLQSHCGRAIWRHLHGSSDTIVPLRGGQTTWNPTPFPDSTTETGRFGGFANVGVVSGAQHTWPRIGDGTWNIDGLTDIWAHIAPFHL
jgi:poly(3-hydroxybutyrate) depolymerase